MNDGAALTGHGWTLANFTGAIQRGGVALWAWSPLRRVAQLDSLCREFSGTPHGLVGIDDLFDRVILAATAHAAREIVTSCLSEGILGSGPRTAGFAQPSPWRTKPGCSRGCSGMRTRWRDLASCGGESLRGEPSADDRLAGTSLAKGLATPVPFLGR